MSTSENFANCPLCTKRLALYKRTGTFMEHLDGEWPSPECKGSGLTVVEAQAVADAQPNPGIRMRIPGRLAVFIDGMDVADDPDLARLVELAGHTRPVLIPRDLVPTLWYVADLLLQLDPDGYDRRAANDVLAKLEATGFKPEEVSE
jgi:hypothetical protein